LAIYVQRTDELNARQAYIYLFAHRRAFFIFIQNKLARFASSAFWDKNTLSLRRVKPAFHEAIQYHHFAIRKSPQQSPTQPSPKASAGLRPVEDESEAERTEASEEAKVGQTSF